MLESDHTLTLQEIRAQAVGKLAVELETFWAINKRFANHPDTAIYNEGVICIGRIHASAGVLRPILIAAEFSESP